MDKLHVIKEVPWQLVGKHKPKTTEKPETSFVPAKGSQLIAIKHNLDDSEKTIPLAKKQKTAHISDKRWKADDEQAIESVGKKLNVSKKRKLDNIQAVASSNKRCKIAQQSESSMPLGIRWDADNYSCSYDSFFTILYNIWLNDADRWTQIFESINQEYLGVLATGFADFQLQKPSLEDVRDSVRLALHENYPDRFPMGQVGASVGELAFKMLQSDRKIAKSQLLCTSCDTATNLKWDKKFGYKLDAGYNTPSSITEWMSSIENETNKKCPNCSEQMIKQVSYTNAPELVVFEYPEFDITTNHTIILDVQDDKQKILHLRGIFYHGNDHFTSKIVTTDGILWFNDGISTGQK